MSWVKIAKVRAVTRWGVKQHLSALLTFIVWFQWNLDPNICTKCCLVLARTVESCAERTACRATKWRFKLKERLRKVWAPLQVLDHLPYCLVYNHSAFRSCKIWDIQTDINKEETKERHPSSTRLYGTSLTAATAQMSVYPPLPPKLNQFNFQKSCSVYLFGHV
jgi:hypothetical protein